MPDVQAPVVVAATPTQTATTTAQQVGTSGLYVGSGVAVIHWAFQCIEQRHVVQPDEVTAAVLSAALTHLSTKVSGLFAKRPKAERVIDVAAEVARAIEAAGIPQQVAALIAAQPAPVAAKPPPIAPLSAPPATIIAPAVITDPQPEAAPAAQVLV